MATQLYFARRPFEYGNPSKQLDFGQVVELGGFRTDAKLVEYGHLAPFKPTPTNSGLKCKFCGEVFVDHAPLNMHGRLRHPDTPYTVQQMDDLMEAEAQRLDKMAPLNMGGTIEVKTGEPVKKRRGRKPKAAVNN